MSSRYTVKKPYVIDNATHWILFFPIVYSKNVQFNIEYVVDKKDIIKLWDDNVKNRLFCYECIKEENW